MKEVFININKGRIKWFGPSTTGSEPILDGDSSEVLGRVVKFLVDLSAARGEHWAFVFNRQTGV